MWSNLLENLNITWNSETKLGEILANKKVLKPNLQTEQALNFNCCEKKKTVDVNKAAARTIVVNNTENVKISPMNKCQNRLSFLSFR